MCEQIDLVKQRFIEDAEYWFDEITEFCTEDRQKIVYCKDCARWAVGLSEKDRKAAIKNPHSDCCCDLYWMDGFGPNDFCSKGVPR